MRWSVAGAARSRVVDLADLTDSHGLMRLSRSVVSLHAHTHHSVENLGEVPDYVAGIPVLAAMFAREARRVAAGVRGSVDLSKGWWRPPVSPTGVFESEARQAEERFHLAPIVSITDHDSIGASADLLWRYQPRCAPVSFEWTVPWESGFFHLGVHNLPSREAPDWFERLSAFTNGRSAERLSDLIVALHDLPGALFVFNHPGWDIAMLGPSAHRGAVAGFLAAHRAFIHAIELNGYRSFAENAEACRLARETGLPVISGGDRHGCAPNALVNLTAAETFAAFADEVRAGDSRVVVMPEYHEPLPGRMLASIADVLRHYRAYPADRRRWTDRVACEWQGAVRPLSAFWPTGGPWWVRSAIGTIRLLSTPQVRSVLNQTARLTGRSSRGAVGTSVTLEEVAQS